MAPLWTAKDDWIGFFSYHWWFVWVITGIVIFILRQWHVSVREYHRKRKIEEWKKKQKESYSRYYLHSPDMPYELQQESGSGFLTFLFCLNLFAFLIMGFVAQTNYYTNWTNTTAYPYINNLPVEKYTIKYIKPEILTEETGGRSEYSYTEEKVLVYYEKSNGQIVESDLNANVSMSLASNDTPYIEYQTLNQDLSQEIGAGMWNIHIYLPANYQFDTMK